jgi:hypothetical protein
MISALVREKPVALIQSQTKMVGLLSRSSGFVIGARGAGATNPPLCRPRNRVPLRAADLV